jgi:fatty-acyl-CoA synthase
MIIDSLGSSESLGMGAAVQTAANAGEATKFVHDENTLVLDEDMRPVVPGSGVMGRIARGGLIPRGYYKDEAKSAATFVTVDGARYSFAGDWATVEADGSLTLLGRGSQCINTGGEKVFPEEVEEALKTHPGVDDALVFGVADEKWGQRVTAVVEGGINDLDALGAHVRGMLAGYKTPKHIVRVAKVPRAPNGKADYTAARALAEG